MTALQQIQTLVRQLRARLQWFAALRGFAVGAAVALSLTILLAFICNRYQFAPQVVWPLRLLLFAVVAVAVVFALVLPVLRVTRQRATHVAEQSIPGLQQRLLTVTERPDASNPFSELVAEDALRVANENAAGEIGRSPWRWVFAAAGALSLALLLWFITAAPGYLGYGASLLWTGFAPANQKPLYTVLVQPGNKTIRRKSEQWIEARIVGFSAHAVKLHARLGSSSKWQDVAMQPGAAASEYRFLFPSVAEPIDYYVQADAARSRDFRISVKDLPLVKRVRIVLHYPSALHLQDTSNDPGGDVRAVEGTTADVFVLTDRPLERGVLALDKEQPIELTKQEGNWSKASLPVKRDGSYHVAALDSGEAIRISDDYFIEAQKDEPPVVRIVRPGHDPRVSPIEEVPVSVEASDDFGVQSLELHYSVNGGGDQVARLKTSGQKTERGHTLLTLENFHLAPGDVISMYATASDATKTTRSEILFAQAEAFDYKFSQSQSGDMGGMSGGMNGADGNISERQKQIIAATFNEMRGDPQSKAMLQDRARFLSDLEGKLSAQAKTLADRMGNRELSQANAEFENFSKLMTMASSEMTDAVQSLSPGKWNDALVPEQKALQSLLRAEAIFRDIQVAFGQAGGGGGEGGAQRDLARMFDLELDTSKNQYETAQKSQEEEKAEQQKAIDDAFARLQALAQRQQELAQQHNSQQPAEQRWQEEQLRRQAEELKRQLQQLAQSSQQQSAGQSASQQQSGRQSSSAQGSGGHEMNDAMRRSSESLAQAEDEMRRAVSSGDKSAEDRASGQLAEAQRALQSALDRQAGNSLKDLAQQANDLANRQRDVARRLKQMYATRSGSEFSSSFAGGESGEMQEMNDPDHPRFGYGYLRRGPSPALRPLRAASPDEESIAAEKDKLAQQLQQLQRGVSEQEQQLRSTSPDASRQLQRALSDAEQKELALRMQKNAQWIREGYGDRNLGMEDNVTAGLDRLSRDLQSAQQMVDAGGKTSPNAEEQKTAEALSQVRKLREMIERAQSSQSQPGAPQSDSPSSGGSGQSSAQPSQPGGGASDTLQGRDLQNAIGQLSHLRGQISGEDRALGNYIGGALGYLRDLNADPRVLNDAIGRDTVGSLERLESELTRRLGEQQTQDARSSSSEKSSEQYRDAVAEYFKRLSQTQPK